jgi:glycosyltransferase involved in cell wall biosynthesis
MRSRSKQNDRVSVVIPLYNHDRFVASTIWSVLNQSVSPCEIIVIDDGSSDRSAEIAQALAEKHRTVKFWSRPNQGAHSTINEGITAATGEFISVLNSDDLYHPNRLEQCLTILDQHPEISAVFSALSFIDENGRKRRNRWYEGARAFYDQIGDLGLALLNGNFLMTTSNLIARRSAFQDVGPFANLRYAHDLDFFLRLYIHGKKMYLIDEPLLQYRLHASNTISENPRSTKVEWAAVVAFFLLKWWKASPRDRSAWEFLGKLIQITDRHLLTGPVVFFLTHLSTTTESIPDSASLLDNGEFQKFIHEVIV